MEETFWICTKKSTFCITTKDNIVVETAPIAKKSIGRNIKDVLSFYRTQQGAKIIKLKEKAMT